MPGDLIRSPICSSCLFWNTVWVMIWPRILVMIREPYRIENGSWIMEDSVVGLGFTSVFFFTKQIINS